MIALHGRTRETSRPDLALVITAADGHATIRVDDLANPPFWVNLTIPLADLRRLVRSGDGELRYPAVMTEPPIEVRS